MVAKLIERINSSELDEVIFKCSMKDDLTQEKKRYIDLVNKAYEFFGDGDYHIFSTPGRTEVGGNHTDHQNGRVLAASVNMDMIAVACKNDDVIEIESDGFVIEKVYLNDLNMKDSEINTSESLVRGICFRMKELGFNVNGFKAVITSSVLKGSGISSSAAFEVLIGTIINHLYNDGSISSTTIAQIGQYAENKYFGKPSGLMDQMACATGGFVFIDFKDNSNPVVKKIDFDFSKTNRTLCLVDTRGSHEDLSDEYGLMPEEMYEVAKLFNKRYLSEITLKEFLSNLKMIRENTSDRALLRAYHFLTETERVLDEVDALENADVERFNELIIESGKSSYMYLQNVYSPTDVTQQELSVALAVSECLLKYKGSYRVHGGGLAGTIQAFVPNELLDRYIELMESCFGEGCCFLLAIRPIGAIMVV